MTRWVDCRLGSAKTSLCKHGFTLVGPTACAAVSVVVCQRNQFLHHFLASYTSKDCFATYSTYTPTHPTTSRIRFLLMPLLFVFHFCAGIPAEQQAAGEQLLDAMFAKLKQVGGCIASWWCIQGAHTHT